MITIHKSLVEQDLIDLEDQMFSAGKAYYERLGRSFIDGLLVSQDGAGNDLPNAPKTDYRQLVRFDEVGAFYWIKSASNFNLQESVVAGLQAIADSYESVSTVDDFEPTVEEE